MTYGDLKNQLEKLSREQLEKPVTVKIGEEPDEDYFQYNCLEVKDGQAILTASLGRYLIDNQRSYGDS